jgi:hypothetical protein
MSEAVRIVGKGQTGQYPPKMFDANTLDLAKKSITFGLDEQAVKSVNIKRYMRNLDILEVNGMKLAIMPEQTNEMVLTALYQNIKAFKHVTNQTPEVCEFALSIDNAIIQYFDEQTDAQIIYAIAANVSNISFVKNPKIEHIKFALSIDTNHTLKYINKKYITDEVIRIAIDELEFEFSSITCQNNYKYDQISPLKYFCTPELVEYALSKNVTFLLEVEGEFLTKEVVMQILKIDVKFIESIKETALNLLDYKVVFKAISSTGWGSNNKNWVSRLNKKYLTMDLFKEFVGGSLDSNKPIFIYSELTNKFSDRLKEFTDEELVFLWPNGIDIGDIYGRPVTEILVKNTLRGAVKRGRINNQLDEINNKTNEFKYIKFWWALLAKLRLL